MEKFIIIQNEGAELKNIYIYDRGIKALDKNLKTQEHFLKSFEAESNGALGTKDHILYQDIQSISTFNDDFGVQIKYNKRDGASETSYLEFETVTDKTEVKDYILSKICLTRIDIKSENKKSLHKRLLITITTLGLMIILYFFLTLSKIILITFAAILIGLYYWIHLAVTKKNIEEEKYAKNKT